MQKKKNDLSTFKSLKSRVGIKAGWAALWLFPAQRALLERLVSWFRFGHKGLFQNRIDPGCQTLFYLLI